MSSADRSQRALDRWVASRGSSWAAGLEFERFVGHEYEKEGYRVQYTGATEGLEDMGRDLICDMPKRRVQIVQCKRWSEYKTVREKHLFQLHGTALLYSIENPLRKVEAVFVTTTHLSERAREVARRLNIIVIEGKECPKEWPRIKCAARGEDLIYHLPFDQQYDRIVMDHAEGDFFAWTCHEAELAGFRRAKRWMGT